MARPKSEDKRNAILDSALHIFAELGLGAPTAKIAKGAGVAEGTLFNYFETKYELLNQLYLELKVELRDIMLPGFPRDQGIKARLHHTWCIYVDWGVAQPQKRKVMALLMMSDRLTPQSREAGQEGFRELGEALQMSVDCGVLRDQPVDFTAAIMRSLSETTMDFMSLAPEQAERYREAGFVAYWNEIARD